MEKGKRRKGTALRLLTVLVSFLIFSITASAGVKEGNGEYEIYPTPQSVAYGTGTVSLSGKVNLILGENIDTYTEKRVDDTLEVLGLEKSIVSLPGSTNLIVGVYGSGDEADIYGQTHGAEASFYEKYDAYTLWIDGKDIVILGQDVDAAYYGVTTLKRIFEQLDGKSVRELTVRDYAEVEFRGFIEGYYGNPWSMDDRVDLMQFGGEIKMNQYVFAPKDDPYHNAKWRSLYPEEDLKKISRLAQAGNESKCFFVYALHPFMNNAINLSDATYESEVQVLKNKFAQVIEAGVRQIAILEDDAAGETAAHVARLLTDMNAWLYEMKKTYPDLKTDLLYCPTCYMATTDAKLNTIHNAVNDEIHFLMTGGKIWGEVSNTFADGFYNGLASNSDKGGRYPYMWVNWPCNDNTKTSQIMGGHNYILHTGVDGKKYEGVILNPIQESEPSKVAIFTASDYCWQTWDKTEEGDQAWEDAFKYIDHMTAVESKESQALKETAKHMISQGPGQITAGKQVYFEESVELSPKLSEFTQKLSAGTLSEADITNMRAELQKIADAASYYLESGTNRRMAKQMIPFLSCLHDETQAGAYLMDSVKAIQSGEVGDLWGGYAEAQALYEKSGRYGFDYYGQGTIYAEAGRRYLKPFVDKIIKYVSEEVKEVVYPSEGVKEEKYTGTFSAMEGWTLYQGEIASMTDGDDATNVWYNPSTTVKDQSLVGDYIQLDLGKEERVGRVRVLVGASGSSDKWVKYHLESSVDGENWTEQPVYTGEASGADIYQVNLGGAAARYLRVVNDQTVAKWVKFSEFSAYSFVGSPKDDIYTNTEDKDWEAEYGEDASRLLPREGAVLQPGQYVGLKLSRIRAVTEITVAGAGTEKLTVEKSMNQGEWKKKTEAGAARYIRLMNQTNQAVSFDLDTFRVVSDEKSPMDLHETTIANFSSGEDARTQNTTKNWMDGDLSSKAKYCGTPAKGDYVTYDLGQEIDLRSLRVYVLDTAIDYPRDAKVQASMDNETWTDILTIGDGVENGADDASKKPVESGGGWIHDTVDVAYAYVENAAINNLKARYIRLYFTAGYAHRWVELNEIRINGGEYISSINDPTFETNASLQKGYEPQNLNDGDLTTAFRPTEETDGYVIYHLSEGSPVGRLNILQSGGKISNAAVSVRTGADTWVELGKLDKSFSAFYTAELDHVYDVKLEWKDTAPVIYEIITLENPGDLLEKNLAEAKKELEAAKTETAEAVKAVQAAEAKVKAAQASVNGASKQVDKLKAEVELQKLSGARAAAEALAAEKKAAEAQAAAKAAAAEAKLLRAQAAKAESEAEKARLEKEAQAKEKEEQEKGAEAQAQEKLAGDKKKEQASYEKAAADKQKELDNFLKNPGDNMDPVPGDPNPPVTPVLKEFNYKNVKYKVLSTSSKTAAAVGVTTKKVKAVTVYSTVKKNGVNWKIVQIGSGAFKGCKKLTKVTVGSNVKKIGNQAFAQCTRLKTVNMKKATKISSIGKKAFTKISSKAVITVPAKKRKAYTKMLKKAGVPKKASIR